MVGLEDSAHPTRQTRCTATGPLRFKRGGMSPNLPGNLFRQVRSPAATFESARWWASKTRPTLQVRRDTLYWTVAAQTWRQVSEPAGESLPAGSETCRHGSPGPVQRIGGSTLAKKLDHIIGVDVESTCWKDQAPPGEESEIIEIGICPVELGTLRRLGKRSILVKPGRSRVSEFCTRLTTITPEQVERGITFTEACEILRKEYQARERVWASYGDYDRTMFQTQCQATGVPYPFGPRHLNVKTLFALSRGLPHEVGMGEALALMNVPLEGTHHRGDDDAWNIAGILTVLVGKLRG